MSGVQYPDIIPAYHAWERLFRGVREKPLQSISTELGVDDLAAKHLRAASDMAFHRVAAGGRGPLPYTRSGLLVPSISLINEAWLDGRDELIRALPATIYKRVEGVVYTALERDVYTFDVLGEKTDAGGCQLRVNGRERPDLIPEAFYWESYFLLKATTANRERDATGRFSTAFLRIQQSQRLPIPTNEIETILQAATSVATQLERLRTQALLTKNADNGLTKRLAIAQVVLDGRADLVRRLPSESWRFVQAEGNNTKASSVYMFPAK